MLGQMLVRRGARATVGRTAAQLGDGALPRSAMSSTGTTTSTSSGLRMPASTMVHRARPPGAGVPAEEAGDLLERALRGRQPDALRRAGRDLLEPLERQRQVGAALGGGEGVDLVDDDGLDAGERLARPTT